MRGSIQKKGGQYYIVLDIGIDPKSRRRKQKWISANTNKKKVAEAMLEEIQKRSAGGKYIEPSKLTLEQYLNKWLEGYAKHSVRSSTYDSYCWVVNKHLIPRIGHFKLEELKPLYLQEFFNSLFKTKLSATSIRYVYNILKEALTQAVKWQIIVYNPCLAVEAPRKIKYQAQVFTAEQLATLITAAQDTNVYLPILLAVTCGLRRGEICGLRWQDTDLEQGMLHVKNSLDWENSQLTIRPVKTASSQRSVKLPQIALETLKAVKIEQAKQRLAAGRLYHKLDFVWAWDDGRPHDPDYLYHHYHKLLVRYNKSITDDPDIEEKDKAEMLLPVIRFHDLRHSHATYLLASGVPIKIISERLGHSSTRVTQDIYSHVLPQMQEMAAAKIDNLLQTTKPEQKEGGINADSL